MACDRIRYTTSHPADMDDTLIAAHGEVDKLMPYLHLPVQSGSNRILKAMNRSHTVETYLATLDKMRACPAGHRLVRRLHRRFSGRDRRRLRGYAAARRCRRLRFGLFVQIQSAARHAGRHDGGPDPAGNHG